MIKLQKILFWIWFSTLAITPILGQHKSFENLDNSIILGVVGTGVICFLSFWIIAIIRHFKGEKANSIKIPLHSIWITTAWIILLATFSSGTPNPPKYTEGKIQGATSTKQSYTCYKPDGTAFQTTINCNEYEWDEPTTIPQQKTVNTTPQIDCTGPDSVVFKTTQTKCDEFNSAWNNTKKETAQDTPYSLQPKYEIPSTTQQPPCTVGSHTYYYTDPTTCNKWQQEQKEYEENLNSIQFTQPTVQVDNQPTNQEVLEYELALDDYCRELVTEWTNYRNEFVSTEMYNYSSSVEGYKELIKRKSLYQDRMEGEGCYGYYLRG